MTSVSASTGVALVGCGTIAPEYARTIAGLEHIALAACCDGVAERADSFAAANGATVMTFDELLAEPSVSTVVNLTPPSAHTEITAAALGAGKHVFSEKPLGIDFAAGLAVTELAQDRALRLGCAPDTFLGAGLQTARAVIDRGDIGEPVAANAFMLGAGPELWHPDPAFFYANGAGPLFDMGPYYLTALVNLLGPAVRVSAVARSSRNERIVASGPYQGSAIPVEVPTHVSSLIEFEAGPAATLVTSFDVPASHYRNIEIYGSEATLAVPDPNFFGGPVMLRGVADHEWREVDLIELPEPQARGIGLADMVEADQDSRPHRASAELALHVLELMTATLASAELGEPRALTTHCSRPDPRQPMHNGPDTGGSDD